MKAKLRLLVSALLSLSMVVGIVSMNPQAATSDVVVSVEYGNWSDSFLSSFELRKTSESGVYDATVVVSPQRIQDDSSAISYFTLDLFNMYRREYVIVDTYTVTDPSELLGDITVTRNSLSLLPAYYFLRCRAFDANGSEISSAYSTTGNFSTQDFDTSERDTITVHSNDGLNQLVQATSSGLLARSMYSCLVFDYDDIIINSENSAAIESLYALDSIVFKGDVTIDSLFNNEISSPIMSLRFRGDVNISSSFNSAGCTNLMSLNFQGECENISITNSFNGSEENGSRLTSITFPGDCIISNSFNNHPMLSEVSVVGNKTIYTDSFNNCPNLNVDALGRIEPANLEEPEILSGWIESEGAWTYYVDGTLVTGWQTINGKTYLFDDAGLMLTGFVTRGSNTYYFDTNGACTFGWKKIDNVWYYFNTNGAMQTGWKSIDGKWYYFGSDGAMKSGWQKIDNKWYYFNSNGSMQTGWLKNGNNWYYFESNGAMATGWKKVGSTWYHFTSSGAMQTGWYKEGSTWYYFEASGAMATGWKSINGVYYYFESSGAMASNRWIGNYYVDSTGAWTQSR